MFDHLHRAVDAIIVFDEAADEADHHGRAGRKILDGRRRNRGTGPQSYDEREIQEDKPDEDTHTAHGKEGIIARKSGRGVRNSLQDGFPDLKKFALDEN